MWLLHYFGLLVFVVIACASIKDTEKFFFGRDGRDLGLDEGIIYVSSTVLVVAMVICLAAHWVPLEIDDIE